MADQYQPILQVTDHAPGGVLLTVQRAAGGECREWFFQFKNRYPWQPLGRNELHLLPFWSAPRGQHPPCRICVTPANRTLVPEVQSLILFVFTVGDDPPAVEFRVRPHEGAGWSGWGTLDAAALAAGLMAAGAPAATVGETVSIGDSFRSWFWLAGIRAANGRPSQLMQVETRINPETTTLWTAERLQTGGGGEKNEYQLVCEVDGVATNGTLSLPGVGTASIQWSDSASATAAALESMSGTGTVAVPIKINNLLIVKFQGDRGNANVLQLVPSTGLAVATIADGGPL